MIHYMLLDFTNMIKKRARNQKANLDGKKNNKYSFEWYKSPIYGFKENNIDNRMNLN